MYRSYRHVHPVQLGVVAALALIIISMFWPRPQPARMTQWAGATVMTSLEGRGAPAQPAPISGSAQAVGDMTLAVDDGLFADQRDALSAELQDALTYVTTRVGSRPAGTFVAAVRASDGCALHGLAYTEQRHVEVYACNTLGRQRAVNILAHEFVHQLAADQYGNPHYSADLILLEGYATWGAGRYWLGGQPDFRSFVRNQRAAGINYPLATHYEGHGVAAMNALYYQWASFVEFLLERYGRARFDTLYASGGNRVPGGADYVGAYGRDLATLEAEWNAWVDQ